MPSNQFLSQDAVGFSFEEETLFINLASESSALALSAIQVPAGIMKKAGRVVAAFIGVGAPSVSASGYVSGTVDANVRINSALVLSTAPAIHMAGSAGQVGRRATNIAGQVGQSAAAVSAVSGVVNQASAAFSAGAMISIDYNLRSMGSAAAGAAGTGFYVGVVVRYETT